MAEKVLAKMKCMGSLQRGENWNEVSLWAEYGDGKGNEDFAEATPYGNITMGISKNVPASDFFKEGKQYIVTFEEAPE